MTNPRPRTPLVWAPQAGSPGPPSAASALAKRRSDAEDGGDARRDPGRWEHIARRPDPTPGSGPDPRLPTRGSRPQTPARSASDLSGPLGCCCRRCCCRSRYYCCCCRRRRPWHSCVGPSRALLGQAGGGGRPRSVGGAGGAGTAGDRWRQRALQRGCWPRLLQQRLCLGPRAAPRRTFARVPAARARSSRAPNLPLRSEARARGQPALSSMPLPGRAPPPPRPRRAE